MTYLTSQTAHPDATFDYLLVDWAAAGLLKPTLMKPRVAVLKETLVKHNIGTLSAQDLAEVEGRLRRVMDLM